jgi:DNA repair protein RecO (recombination protein O)
MFAITLLRRDFKENDEAISFYTKEIGKVDAIARGVKKIISKNTSSLEPFSLLDIELVKGKDTTYVTKAVVLENFSGIRNNLDSLVAGNFVLKNLEISTKVGQKDEKIFLLTYRFLKILNNSVPSSLLFPAYLLQLWSELGFTPDFSGCRVCNVKSDEKEYFFDTSQGKIICEVCSKDKKNKNILKSDNVKILKKLLKESPAEIQKLKIKDGDLFLIQNAVKDFVEYHGNCKIVWGNYLLRKKSDKADLRGSK